MEAAGLAIGIAGLAGLFASCIDCYRSIQRGVSLDRDYKILQTKFDNQELRLYAWGTACGLNTGAQHYEDVNATEAWKRIFATLQCIFELFQDQNNLQKRYGLRSADKISHSRPLRAHIEDPRSKPRLGTFFRRKKQQRSQGLFETVLWVIDDYQKFNDLVQHLKDFNDDLEAMTRLTNIASRQRLILEYEVEEIDDLEILEDVESAGHDGSDIVSDTASLRLAGLKEGSIRTVRSDSIRDSISFQTVHSDIIARQGSLRSTVSVGSVSFQTTRSDLPTREGSLRSVISMSTHDSISFQSAHSKLSARERLSIEFQHDELHTLGVFLYDEEQQDDGEQLMTSVSRATPLFEATRSAIMSSATGGQALEEQVPMTSPVSGEPVSSNIYQTHRRKNGPKSASTFKILAIGPEGCNSTNLLTVFSLGYWPSTYRPTTFKDYVTDCRIDGKPLQLLLVDTAGQQAYPNTRKLCYANSDIILLCFRADKPLADAESAIEEYILEAEGICPGVRKILVGVHDPDVELTAENGKQKDEKQRQEFAKYVGANKYLWCNPESGEGVDDVFETASRIILYQKFPRPQKQSRFSSLLRGLGAVAEDEESPTT